MGMGTNVLHLNINQEGSSCTFDILNGGSDGLRVGFNAGGVWLQAISKGNPGNYYWSNH